MAAVRQQHRMRADRYSSGLSSEERMVDLTNDMRQGQTPFDELRLSGRFPPAMAYVPWQQWKTPYDPAKGLSRGTIFEELDLPFEKERCRGV